MGTSKSNEWTATALVFSGRVDPVWEVPPEWVARLLAAWEELAPGGSPVQARPLGYRGVALSAPDGRTWLANDRIVVLEDGLAHDTRVDIGRSWEHMLVGTAPEGLVPPIDA
jgi:hypothetical protein